MGKFITLIVVIGLIVFGSWFYWKYYYTYSDGNRTGLLQKFSRRGNFFKTYEGELVLNNMLGTNGTSFSSEKFYFSVDNPNVAKQLMNYEGQRIVVHYEQKNGAAFWRGDTEYIVDSVMNVHQ